MTLAWYDKHERFSPVTLALHWLLAVAIVGMIFFGISLEDLPEGEVKTMRVGLHVSIGFSVFVAGCVRLLWRLRNGLPEPAGDHARWERKLTRVVHVVLLVAPIYLPLAGAVWAIGKGYVIEVFGLALIPGSDMPREALADVGSALHGPVGFLLLLVVLLHVAGALKHHIKDKDATLRRMLGGEIKDQSVGDRR